MRRRLKSFFSLLLAVSLMMSLLSGISFADENDSYICGKEEHTHDESCYKVQFAAATPSVPVSTPSDTDLDEDTKEVWKLICRKEEHVHGAGCMARSLIRASAADAQPDIQELISYIDNTPTILEMHQARSAFSNHADYSAYVDENLERIASASNAYRSLSEEDQALVTNASRLEEPDEDVLLPFDHYEVDIPASDGEYTYWLGSRKFYEYSLHQDVNHDSTGTMLMTDTSQHTGLWSPQGEYIPGVSDYVVVYCCDWDSHTRTNTMYKRINLEDADYYHTDEAENKKAAEHIRAIAMNSYPFISLEQMNERLENANVTAGDSFEAFTRSELTTAAQLAIWYYSNRNQLDDRYGYSDFVYNYGSTRTPDASRSYRDMSYDGWYWHNNSYTYIEEAEARIEAVVDYLIHLDGDEVLPEQVVIDDIEIVYMNTDETDSLEQFPVELKVILNGTGSSNDSFQITAAAQESGESVTVNVTGGSRSYTLPQLLTKPGEEITVTLTGTQILPKGAYFYESKPLSPDHEDYDPDYDMKRYTSQNMVGVAMGATSVAAQTTVQVKDSSAITLKKIDAEDGTPLRGAEFSLYHVNPADTVHEEESILLGTYTVEQEDGTLTIGGLMPGRTYEIKETKAPDGYEGLDTDQLIRFHVEEDGTVQIDQLPEGISYTSGKQMVILKNRKNEEETTEESSEESTEETTEESTQESSEEDDDETTGSEQEETTTSGNTETTRNDWYDDDDDGGDSNDNHTKQEDHPETSSHRHETSGNSVSDEASSEKSAETLYVTELPKTGDTSSFWLILALLSGLSLISIHVIEKRYDIK